MPHISSEKLLSAIVKSGLFATLIIPFITLDFLVYPSISGQALIFQFFIEFLLLFYIPLILLYPRYRPRIGSKTTIGILVYFGAIFVTALFSANPAMSWWSSLQRSSGIVFMLHILVYYFMLVSVFMDTAFRTPLGPTFVRGESKTPLGPTFVRGEIWFLRALVAAGAIMAIIVIFQSFHWIVTATGETRPYGTLGNSDFLGTYLLFSIYFSLLLFIKEKPRLARGFIAIAFALVIWALIANATRAVFVGIAASVIFYLLIAPFTGMPQASKKIYRAIAAIFAVSFIVIILTIANALPSVLYNRVALLQRIRDTAIHGNDRIIAWQSGLRAFHEQPTLGFGPENFSIGFNKGYDSRFGDMLIRDEMMDFDKAHNIIIEILGTSGVIGIAGYVFFVIMLTLVFWKNKNLTLTPLNPPFVRGESKTPLGPPESKTPLNPPFVRGESKTPLNPPFVRGESKTLLVSGKLNGAKEILVLAALFIAYQTDLLFSLDTPASYTLFMMLLAFIEIEEYRNLSLRGVQYSWRRSNLKCGLKIAQDMASSVVATPSSRMTKNILLHSQITIQKFTVVCIIFYALAVPFIMNIVVVKPIKANYAIANAKEKNASLEIVFQNYSKAIEYNSVYTSDIVRDFAKTALAEIPYYNSEQETLYRYLEDKLKKYDQKYDWQWQLQFARVYNILCDKDKKHCADALQKIALAIKLAPNRPRIYTEGFIVAYKMRDYHLARKFIEQAMARGYSPEGIAPMEKLIKEVYQKNLE